MRADRIVAASLAVLTLTSCASYSWTKPGVPEAERDRDQHECWARSRALPPQPTTLRPSRDAAPRQAVFELCLEARGYTKVRD